MGELRTELLELKKEVGELRRRSPLLQPQYGDGHAGYGSGGSTASCPTDGEERATVALPLTGGIHPGTAANKRPDHGRNKSRRSRAHSSDPGRSDDERAPRGPGGEALARAEPSPLGRKADKGKNTLPPPKGGAKIGEKLPKKKRATEMAPPPPPGSSNKRRRETDDESSNPSPSDAEGDSKFPPLASD